MDCCGYDDVFTERQARRQARRFERLGPTGPTRTIADWLVTRGLHRGASVLEIGGGVGDLQVELLRRGAARTVNVELTRSWEGEAGRLLRRSGFADRTQRLVGDLVTQPGLAGAADVVILNRVVCCYPDYAGLLRTAGERARAALVFTHPPRSAFVRCGLQLVNAWERARGRDYRAFAHPPEAMLAVLADVGLRPVTSHRSGMWWLQGLERVAPGAAGLGAAGGLSAPTG